MAVSLISFVVSVLGVIGFSLFKPELKIGKVRVDTYWMVPLLGAIVVLVSGVLPFRELQEGLLSSSGINPLQILVIFLSMSYISIALDTTGFFGWMSSFAARKAHGSQIRFFFALYLVISVLTVFTSNDIIILTFTPFIIGYSRKVKINPVPYLVMEFVAANTWSSFLLIGNPTNIYITGSLGIGFAEYILKMGIPTAAVGLVSLGMTFLVFHKKLRQRMEYMERENPGLDKPLMALLLIVLFCTIVLMGVSSFLSVPMYLFSLGGFVCSLIIVLCGAIHGKSTASLAVSFRRVPYSVIPFLLSMFVISLAMKEAGIPESIATFLNKMPETFSYGVSAFLSCNLMNNIPMSVLFSEILKAGSAGSDTIYAVVLSSNLGAIFTPIGALASIMWMSSLHRENIRFTYLDFVKYGAVISAPALLVGLAAISFL